MTVDEAWDEKWFRDAVHAWGCAIMVMGKNLGRLVVCIVHEFDVEAQVCVCGFWVILKHQILILVIEIFPTFSFARCLLNAINKMKKLN